MFLYCCFPHSLLPLPHPFAQITQCQGGPQLWQVMVWGLTPEMPCGNEPHFCTTSPGPSGDGSPLKVILHHLDLCGGKG